MISLALLPLLMTSPPPAQADTGIARIRSEVAAVNAMLPRCTSRTQDAFGMSTEGGEMRVYRCGGAIRKIAATFYGETGRSVQEWYFTQDRPIFAYTVDLRYDRPFGRVARRTEERVYLRGGRMIRWLDGSSPRSVTSRDAEGRLREIADAASELLDRARTGRTDAQ